MNLGELLQLAAIRNPGRAALYCGEESITYAELDRSTSTLAGWLLSQGLQPGDRVAIHWTNTFEPVKLYFACFKAGLIAVPVNTRLKAPEIAYILEHSGAKMCFSQPGLPAPSGRVYRELPAVEGPPPSLPAVDPARPAAILYTSGTVARPKGVTHTHETLFHGARLMTLIIGDAVETILVPTSLMHVSGLCCDLLPAVSNATTAVLLPVFDPAAALNAVERRGCTYTLMLPALIQFLAEEQARQPRNVRSLGRLLAAGDRVPVTLQERFQALFGIPLQEGLGMTETGPGCLNRPEDILPGSVGKPIDGIEVQVIAPGGARAGAIGEMIVRSPANCIGYWNDSEATAAALRDGWLYTGDLVRRDAQGYFWFEGRKKEIIVRGGSNISPQEVEEALYQHPAVLEAGVIGVPDCVYGERVVAFVALREGMDATESDLLDFARERLADYKAPERILFLAELPKGITGKVQRRALKEIACSQADLLHQHLEAGVRA